MHQKVNKNWVASDTFLDVAVDFVPPVAYASSAHGVSVCGQNLCSFKPEKL